MRNLLLACLVCWLMLGEGEAGAEQGPLSRSGWANGPLIYREHSPNGEYGIDMFPPLGDVPAYGRVQHLASSKTLWYVPWYSPGVTLADDGQHLVQYGPSTSLSGKPSANQSSAISFHRAGKLLRAYTADDLHKLRATPARGEKPTVPAGLRVVSVTGPAKENQTFRAVLSDGTVVQFDIRTGAVSGVGPGELPRNEAPGVVEPPVCRGYRQVCRARTLTRSLSAFAQRLYGDVAATARGHNLVLSPSDLATNLLLVSTGARGKTQEELQKALLAGHHGELPDGVVEMLTALHETAVIADAVRSPDTRPPDTSPAVLQSAVSLWLGRTTKVVPDFEKRLTRFRPDVTRRVDFSDPAEAARQINAAVARATRNTVGELVNASALGQETEIVLASATYLSAPWKLPFDRLAQPQAFHVAPDRPVQVPMMRSTDAYRLLRKVDFDLLELLLHGDRLSFVVLLPDINTTLEEAETLLTTQNVNEWWNELDHVRRRTVAVTMPLLELRGERLALAGALERLGVRAAFSSKDADFSGLSGAPQLKLAEVNHQAFLEVDEKGVVAAAGTASSFQPRAPTEERIRTFQVDRPFLFLIRDRASNVILFVGRVVDPTRQS